MMKSFCSAFVKPLFQNVKRELVWKKNEFSFPCKSQGYWWYCKRALRIYTGKKKNSFANILLSRYFSLVSSYWGTCVFIEGHAGAAVEISNVFGSMNNRIEEIVRKEDQTRLTGYKPFSEETLGISSAFDCASPLVRDNNDKELFSFSLQRVVEEEETQDLTSPSLYNSNESSGEVDLMQSIQIRRARILNLTEKRDRLLNLAGLKTNRL